VVFKRQFCYSTVEAADAILSPLHSPIWAVFVGATCLGCRKTCRRLRVNELPKLVEGIRFQSVLEVGQPRRLIDLVTTVPA